MTGARGDLVSDVASESAECQVVYDGTRVQNEAIHPDDRHDVRSGDYDGHSVVWQRLVDAGILFKWSDVEKSDCNERSNSRTRNWAEKDLITDNREEY